MMALVTFQLPHVLVNCVECYSQRFLYEHILNHLNGELSTLVESSSLLKCENMNDFIRLLKQVLKERGLESQTVYIVSLAEFVIVFLTLKAPPINCSRRQFQILPLFFKIKNKA